MPSVLNLVTTHGHGWRIAILAVFLAFLIPSEAWAYDPHLRFPWPSSASHRISSGGNGYSCDTHTGGDYYAIDFEFSTGQEVDAAQGGQVTIVGNDPTGYGIYVVVDHGNGFVSRYAHLQSGSVVVSVNQLVVQNQKLAQADCTGRCTNTHLHFSVRLNGVAYMPEPMSTSGTLAVPVTGFGNYGYCKGLSSVYWGSTVPISSVTQNSSFETYPVFTEDGGPWQRTSGTNWARYSGGVSGSWYLEMNTGSAGVGASLWQRFAMNDSAWSNYDQNRTFVSTPDTWAVRVWMRTPNCGGANGTLAIWALGGAQENGSTPVALNGNWRLFSATVKFSSNGHNRLQVHFYMDTVGCNYDFDGLTFVRNYVNNTSFEDGFSYWGTFHSQPSCTVNYAVYTGSAVDDNKYLETNRGDCTTGAVSIIQDVAAYTAVGDVFTLRVWIRSPGGNAISGTIALWGNGGVQENGALPWSIGSGDFLWHEYVLTKTMIQANHTSVRVEFYLDTNGANYNFDGVQLSGGAGG